MVWKLEQSKAMCCLYFDLVLFTSARILFSLLLHHQRNDTLIMTICYFVS